MSTDSLSDSSALSCTTTTQCVNSDTAESASDSLNSLLDGNVQCIEKCVNVTTNKNGEKNIKPVCNRTIGQCTWGVLLVLISISGFVFSPLDVMLWEKLNMRPGFPPYEWWADPPDEVKLRVYVFNVTNHERFMAGLDSKMDVQEIGPIVYLEKLRHYNIVFNDNDTMTYTANRSPIYLPLENTVDMNATLIVPNLAVLGMASYLHKSPYFVRAGFRFLVNSHSSEFFIRKTVYEYLWDYREPVLDTSKSLAPGIVPVNNMGMLSRIYADFTDEMTVQIGSRWGHKNFFEITRFRGQEQLPGYDPDTCPDRIFGSTEGVMYHQHIQKEDVLLYWRKTVCKLMPLYFDTELTVDNVPVYRFNLSEIVYARVKNGTDCYDTDPSLPDGLSDGSKCYYNFPMVISYPHFYTGQPPKDTFVTGLQPDRFKHNSYIIVEPLTGTPFRSVARMQSNLLVNDLSGFSSDYDKFSNLVLPLFWAEYNQEGLPSHIKTTIYFMTVLLQPISKAIFTIFLFLGFFLLVKLLYNGRSKTDSEADLTYDTVKLDKNNIYVYEKETFLNKC